MKVKSVIENQDVIKKILKHLGLWQVKTRLRRAKQLEMLTAGGGWGKNTASFDPKYKARNHFFTDALRVY